MGTYLISCSCQDKLKLESPAVFLQQSSQLITLLQLKDALFPDPVEFTGFSFPVLKKLIFKSLKASVRTLIAAGVTRHQPCAVTRAAKIPFPSESLEGICAQGSHRHYPVLRGWFVWEVFPGHLRNKTRKSAGESWQEKGCSKVLGVKAGEQPVG